MNKLRFLLAAILVLFAAVVHGQTNRDGKHQTVRIGVNSLTDQVTDSRPLPVTVQTTSGDSAVNRISTTDFNSRDAATLAAGATFQGVGEDVTQYGRAGVSITSDNATDGVLTMEVSRDGVTWGGPTRTWADTRFAQPHMWVIVERYFRIKYVNGTTEATNLAIQVQYSVDPYIQLGHQLDEALLPETEAVITRSVIVGDDSDGVYANVRSNSGRALLTAAFETEVAANRVTGHSMGVAFGRNPLITTATDPEDVWANGGDYTGFNATGNETITVVSSDNDDRGFTLASGTGTGGTATTIVDTGATFSTDGVVAGNIILDDTQSIHGIVKSVDSETQCTVYDWVSIDGPTVDHAFAASDAYRAVTANDTGAAVILLQKMMDEDYVTVSDKYVVMNGTSTVALAGDYMRCAKGAVILSGTTGHNEGAISAYQTTTTANIFVAIPALANESQVCADTVPADKICVLDLIQLSLIRANGSAGSATCSFRVRRIGEVFRSSPVVEIQTGDNLIVPMIASGALPPCTDFKVRVDAVSDNASAVNGRIKYMFKDF